MFHFFIFNKHETYFYRIVRSALLGYSFFKNIIMNGFRCSLFLIIILLNHFCLVSIADMGFSACQFFAFLNFLNNDAIRNRFNLYGIRTKLPLVLVYLNLLKFLAISKAIFCGNFYRAIAM
jgi:hypothetical protein